MKIKLLDFNLKYQPKRSHYNDAGIDVFANHRLSFKPFETQTVSLGFGLELPDGFMANLYVRSSMAKRGLHVHMPPIDSGFRGEIKIFITNLTNRLQVISEGNACGQLVIIPIILASLDIHLGTERGVNGYGSTDKV
jgi:dUTP pyrophosphatase